MMQNLIGLAICPEGNQLALVTFLLCIDHQQMAHTARIRNIFDLYIPLSGPANLESVPLLGKNFGFALAEKNNDESSLQYHITLVYKQPQTNEEVSLPNCFVWAKRKPIRFQRSEETQEVEGIVVRIKLPAKLFDFRRYKAREIRIQVNEIKNGQIIKQAFSNIVQILPINRQGSSDSTDFVPTSPLSQVSPNLSAYVEESPHESFYVDYNQASYSNEDSGQGYSQTNQMYPYDQSNAIELQYLPKNNNNDTELQYIASNNNGEQYMVLYNGNAEVVGNFRALNFYKSSDINIKEDIRLLVEDHDCRNTLLQIDGVKYKFKQGVHPDTNRRFVGYIAQQVESVVPEAVQLIDGILHVDYESLIPYLSESVRANYGDISDLRSKTDRIQRTIDEMYEQFLQKDNAAKQYSTPSRNNNNYQRGSRTKKIVLLAVSCVTILATVLMALAFAGVIPLHSAEQDDFKIPPEFVTAMKDFYVATNGDTWLRKDNWLNEQISICEWYGVKCENTWHYFDELTNGTMPRELWTNIHIWLDNNNLTGTLPSSLNKITWLSSLVLRNNSLTGTITDKFGQLDRLTELRLADNSLTGSLPNIVKYPELRVLDLSRNKFYGTLPEHFLSGEWIAEVNLANNQIDGTIPDCRMIDTLDLSSNRFNGTLPYFGFGLKYLNLANNMLTGDSFAATRSDSLVHLDLSNNQLNGDFHLLPVAFNQMVYLDISNNRFRKWDEVTVLPENLAVCSASNNQFVCPLGSDWMQNKCFATCRAT